VQAAPELALAAQLDVDALVKAEPDEVQRLLDGGVVLGHAAAGVLRPGPAAGLAGAAGVWQRAMARAGSGAAVAV
jgi:hypothetical protein